MRSQDDCSQLAGNLVLFCRTLRRAGLPVGTGQVIDALNAVAAVGVERRQDLRQALRSVLASDPRHFRLFDQAFHVFFHNQRLLEKMMGTLLSGSVPEQAQAEKETLLRRLLEALSPESRENEEELRVEADRTATWSHREVLRQKDFEEMSLAEQSAVKELLREEITLCEKTASRRFRSGSHGSRYDLRRSMHNMMRNNGQLIELSLKRRTERPPVVVLLCDISGSMSHYSRMFLHFAHALGTTGCTVHSFVFGTRLTNISRRMRDPDADRALSCVAADVRDWDGGTRIGESLARFNKDWGRRVLAQNATVVLLSDGLERDTETDLGFQMQRLKTSCRRLIWLNPVLRYAGFEAKAAGIRRMLPHVDLFLPAHNVSSLANLVGVLKSGHGARNTRYSARGAAA
ncbi:MAG TPA: VWA domain-containing protein [Woeseiaceae bacterium]|nr:VWA domain-containing protein [Woeseiaceae bacterium]